MPQVARIFKLNGRSVLNPALLAESESTNRDWLRLANSISCPRGGQSGEAHFLVSSATLAALDLKSPITITCENEGAKVTWQKYYCIRTQAITAEASPSHWITLADRRSVVSMSTGTTGTMRYNLRDTPSSYIDYTTNGGTPWTWIEVIQQLWALLPAEAGFCPSFAFSGSTPENLVFDGMSAWDAINQVLTAIGCAVCLDPIAGTFSISVLSSADSIPSWQNRLLWNYRPQDLSVSTLPQKAAVFIPKLPDGSSAPFAAKPVIIKKPLFGGGLAGTEYVQADTFFWWDDNTALREARATEVGVALRWLLDPMANRWGKVYSGCMVAAPNSRITDVIWSSDGEYGFTTTLLYKPMPIDWPKLHVQGPDGARWIQYEIDSLSTPSSGPYTGLKVATVTIVGTSPGAERLIGDVVDVVDHSGCIFDESVMTGFTGWANEGVFLSLDSGADCDTMSPVHWVAFNRCCGPDTGNYATPCE